MSQAVLLHRAVFYSHLATVQFTSLDAVTQRTIDLALCELAARYAWKAGK